MALVFPKSYYERPKPSRVESPLIRGFSKSDDPAVDLEHAPSEVEKLDISWLPFAAKVFDISANIEDYVLKPMPLMPSDLPNRNGVSFPLAELVRFQPPPVSRQVYKAWTSTPVHQEHRAEDHRAALGVVLDTTLTPIRGYGNGTHWKVMGLIAVDKSKYPDIAAKLLSNELNTGSMGCMADYFTCSVCGHECTDNPMMNCAHITSTREVNWRVVAHNGEQKLAYLNAHGLVPQEFSVVEDPAWCVAASDELIKW